MALQLEEFVTHLTKVLDETKNDKAEISRLQKENDELNEKLRTLGKRLAELESDLKEYSNEDVTHLKSTIDNLISGAIQERASVPGEATPMSCGDFFYKRAKELGVNLAKFYEIMERDDVYVVGDIVLESLLGENLGSTLPIHIYVKNSDAMKVVHDQNHQIGNDFAFLPFLYGPKNDVYQYVREIDRSFSRNFVDGKNCYVHDLESGRLRTHQCKRKNIPSMTMKSGKSYQDFGFCIEVCKAPAGSHGVVLGYKSLPLVPQVPQASSSSSGEIISITLGKGVNRLGVYMVPQGPISMKEYFDAKMKVCDNALAVGDIINFHKSNDIGLVFSGRIVDSSVLGHDTSSFDHIIAITTNFQKVVDIAIDRNMTCFSDYALHGEDLMVREYGYSVCGSRLIIAGHRAKNTTPDIIRNVLRRFACSCAYGEEAFYIYNYENLHNKIETIPNISTRDVTLLNGVATFPEKAKTLAFKSLSMYERLCKIVEAQGFPREFVDDVVAMPGAAIVGDHVLRAMDGKITEVDTKIDNGNRMTIIIFDRVAFFNFCQKYDVGFPQSSYTRYGFVSNISGLSGSAMLIEVITPIEPVGTPREREPFILDKFLSREFSNVNRNYVNKNQFFAITHLFLKAAIPQ